MIAGHASRVESNRARILFDGISRSEYPIAPSMQISVFSPGLLANGFGRALLQSTPGLRDRDRVVVRVGFVRMAFALRGAPCGDESGPRALERDYHDEQTSKRRPTDDLHAQFLVGMIDVDLLVCDRAEDNAFGSSNATPCRRTWRRPSAVPLARVHRDEPDVGRVPASSSGDHHAVSTGSAVSRCRVGSSAHEPDLGRCRPTVSRSCRSSSRGRRARPTVPRASRRCPRSRSAAM